jgi:hypothetical protein
MDQAGPLTLRKITYFKSAQIRNLFIKGTSSEPLPHGCFYSPPTPEIFQYTLTWLFGVTLNGGKEGIFEYQGFKRRNTILYNMMLIIGV